MFGSSVCNTLILTTMKSEFNALRLLEKGRSVIGMIDKNN